MLDPQRRIWKYCFPHQYPDRAISLGADVNLGNRRIILVGGDIGLHQFGLPAEQYQNLIRNVGCIYHCGAQVNTMASYSALRTSNVQGTLEIIRFAIQQFDRPIYYISTLSAASAMDENGAYAETWPPAVPAGLTGGYALSKWVSERLLLQVMQRGLPVKIYRSGYILGESQTGITNLNDALLLLIKGCIQLGYAPTGMKLLRFCRLILSVAPLSHCHNFSRPRVASIIWIILTAFYGLT